MDWFSDFTGVICETFSNETLTTTEIPLTSSAPTNMSCVPTNSCLGHYNCDDITMEKICLAEYYGPDCVQRNISSSNADCPNQQPCSNGGTCFNNTCCCPPGYEGLICEIEVDRCASNPCQNGGNCTDQKAYFVCDCPPGKRFLIEVIVGGCWLLAQITRFYSRWLCMDRKMARHWLFWSTCTNNVLTSIWLLACHLYICFIWTVVLILMHGLFLYASHFLVLWCMMYVQIYLKFSVLSVHPYDPITLTVSELRLWAMLAFLSLFSPSANSIFTFQTSEKCKTM